jgi:hypothetical protein
LLRETLLVHLLALLQAVNSLVQVAEPVQVSVSLRVNFVYRPAKLICRRLVPATPASTQPT